ncbi:ethylene-responsive transcription factor 1A-like protein [Corchorus capsularis]|uniref:Ethylene-responsive transcription factor 1A-like protein n=1 Tax=Corchorus capsularis TaxID=210143 RepID=A0A1R3GNB9_COCAP|nr:ethylene-responsive transcription factor 1A-like protein [Corchorus capsularis]
MEMYPSNYDSDLAMLDSIRRHLLGESLTIPTDCTTAAAAAPPMFCRSSSFSRLYPCLTDNWGELPLKENDSEDMVVFGFLRDALTVGWAPSDYSSANFAPVKPEPQEIMTETRVNTVATTTVASTAVPAVSNIKEEFTGAVFVVVVRFREWVAEKEEKSGCLGSRRGSSRIEHGFRSGS